MAKRKYGEGSVFLRKDGRWEGRIVVGYHDNGNPKTKNVTAKTQAECKEKLQALKEKCGRTTDRLKPDMPFGDWIDFWYQNFSKPKIRPTTQECYENRIYNHIIPEIGKIPLCKLTQNDLQQFYARLKKGGRRRLTEFYGEGLSDRMVRSCHTSCRTALEKAVTEGLITANPAIGCRLPPKKAKEMQVLTQDEIQRFLIQAHEEGYYEFFLLELTTGMRRGEILGLQWKDLNFSTGELHIRRQVVKKGEILISGYTDCGIAIRATDAAGEVYAKTTREITVIFPTNYALKSNDTVEFKNISLIIGKKRINLFKINSVFFN